MAIDVKYEGYNLSFPDGTSDDDIYAYIEENKDSFSSMTQPTEKTEQAPQQEDSILGPTTRMLVNAGANIANIPASVADSVASAASWAGGKLGIGDGTYIPAPRIEVSNEYKPRGAIEEIASEALPFLITGGVSAAPKAATKLGRLEQALTRNASQSVVGSAANNSDGELGADFAADVALNAGVGAGIEKVASSASNLIKAGKESRRARMSESLDNEAGASQHIDSLSQELHNLNRGNRNLEQGVIIDAIKDGPKKGQFVRDIPRTAGELQGFIKSRPDLYGPDGEFNYIPEQVNDYLKRYTNNQYGLYDELPEELANKMFTKEDTSIVRDKILDETRGAYRYLEGSEIGGIADANRAIRESGGGIRYPSMDIGRLSPEAHKQLGLNRLETLVSRIGSFSERNLPLDVGTKSRELSNRAIEGGKESHSKLIDSEIEYLNRAKKNNEGISKTLDYQIDAWNSARDGRKFSELSDDELDNILTSSSQTREHAGNFAETLASISRSLYNLEKAKDSNPYSLGGIASGATAWAFGGTPLIVQGGLAGAGRVLNGSIARDLARVKGNQVFRGDATRNAIGEGLEEGAKKVNTGTYDQVDLELDNDKKIEQLDDWATKNGISQEILSEAVRIKGADLGSLKGINSIKGLALDLDAKARAEDSTLSVGEGYNPNHTLATRQISQAMAEAMYGLSDDEKEAIIDDYLDSVHFEEDEKLVGLKLQRAIQKAVKHALDKSS